jgi:hypothetical protein
MAVNRPVRVEQIFERAEFGNARSGDLGACRLRISVNCHDAIHQLAGVLVARLQFEAGLQIAAAVGVAGREQAGEQRVLGLAGEALAQRTQQQEERGEALLPVDNLKLILLLGGRNQDGPGARDRWVGDQRGAVAIQGRAGVRRRVVGTDRGQLTGS